MSARILRRFFELRPGGRGGRGFSGELLISGSRWLFPRPCFFAALCLAGAPARSPAREWALHPATAVCEVAAAPAERVVAGCNSSAANTQRHSTGLPRWQGAEIWRASTGARDMALVRALAGSASKRKMGPAAGKTAPRRGENAPGARPVLCAETTDPAARGGQAPAGAKRGLSRRGGQMQQTRRGKEAPGSREQRSSPVARSSPLPVARGGRIFASGARGGHDERPLETAGPAALAPAMGSAHTTGTRRTTLGRRGGRRGGQPLRATAGRRGEARTYRPAA